MRSVRLSSGPLGGRDPLLVSQRPLIKTGEDAMATDEEEIRRTMADWRNATLQGDLEAVLALMTDDAVFLTPGNPPMTKTDFAAGFRSFAGKVRIDAKQDLHEIHAAGDLAYAWSRIEVTMTSVDTGTSSQRSGEVLTVFRRSPTGTWLLSRDANLLAASPPPNAAT